MNRLFQWLLGLDAKNVVGTFIIFWIISVILSLATLATLICVGIHFAHKYW